MPERNYGAYQSIADISVSLVLRDALGQFAENQDAYSMVPLVSSDRLDEMLEEDANYRPEGVSFVCLNASPGGYLASLEAVSPADMQVNDFNDMCHDMVQAVIPPGFCVPARFFTELVEHTPIASGVVYLNDEEGERAMAALVVPHFTRDQGFDIINSHDEYMPVSIGMTEPEGFSTEVSAALYAYFYQLLQETAAAEI